MERMEIGDFLLIAEIHSGIPAEQLARMPRVLALAQSSLAAPFAGFGDFEAYPNLCEKAAIYCSRIVRNHPLPDGNKRTGYDVMREFVDRNGATFTHPEGGLMETAQVIEDLAAGTMNENVFKGWVLHRLQPGSNR
jgi:death-on-curing protein